MERDGEHIPFVMSGSYPPRAGNLVRPLVDGGPAFRRICEAVEGAQRSVYVTVAFHQRDFEMPGGHGSFFDVLDRAKARGVDVRVIFWRHPVYEQMDPGAHFSGTEEERAWLQARGSCFLARWDQADTKYCQHQKSWLVDAGTEGEVAFVGGINLDNGSVAEPGHPARAGGNTHDVYVELHGPAATDVHHNFVQRWNCASDRSEPGGVWPDHDAQDELSFPRAPSAVRGSAVVQVQRTVRKGLYEDGTAAPGAEPFAIHEGEYSVVDQYLRAIEAAKRSIYIEDQAIGAPAIVDALHGALERDVAVVFLVPATPNQQLAEARKQARSKRFFDSVAALGRHDHFALVGLAARHDGGEFQHVYVHAKIALVDDAWCTIGSANIGNRSFYGDTELNASFWHAPTVRALRRELLQEHIAEDTKALDDVAALVRYRTVARQNLVRQQQGAAMQGLAFVLDPTCYGN
ncbi:MAG: phosphatidylserine/phosphatidylglycerophosphate/cardiolipin synthase family protein [Myxococcales bacterium]|nr:phosphatidylserine/phosphatidylglycerophosphate/cardiolipin synthase family protein [Myxococcales bacterium]MDD9966888.1 phosphatidylserine/phosphatidylglycerophosphate/cardiolipin synthase family protein [Myxococcales bacterium]